MESYTNPYIVAAAPVEARATFIKQTYLHLAGAILAFVALETALVNSPIAAKLSGMMTGGMSWLIVMGVFMGVSWLADRWAQSDTSRGMQYMGLGIFIVAQAVIFLPLMYVAKNYIPAEEGIFMKAGGITLLLVAAITTVAFVTKKDFSFMKGFLMIGGFIAMGFIVASIVFGFSLGLVFSSVMCLFAGGSILYTTSNVMHHYRTDQHVAASLALFSGVALLFWYVLRILIALRD